MRSEDDETPKAPELRVEIRNLEWLIQQTDHLFDAFFRGLEARPPVLKRDEIKKRMQKLTRDSKISAQDRFLFQTLQSKHIQYEEKWEKALKKRER